MIIYFRRGGKSSFYKSLVPTLAMNDSLTS